MQYVRIPEKRIPYLIGEKGETIKDIEKRTKTKITVKETSVEIEGEALDEWAAIDIVKAIGRGFTPETSLKLLNSDLTLLVIPLKELTNTKKELDRKKGRVIGEKGRSRKHIENMTDTEISVYGNTISIIGSFDNVEMAKEAVEKLIRGSRHSTVYNYLEKQKRKKPTIDYY